MTTKTLKSKQNLINGEYFMIKALFVLFVDLLRNFLLGWTLSLVKCT